MDIDTKILSTILAGWLFLGLATTHLPYALGATARVYEECMWVLFFCFLFLAVVNRIWF